MKLKKIASLALAGVMAVSMLAGCANKPGNNDDNQGEVVETSNAAAVAAMNAAQTKVTFSDGTDLANALQQAVQTLGIHTSFASGFSANSAFAGMSVASSTNVLLKEIVKNTGIGGTYEGTTATATVNAWNALPDGTDAQTVLYLYKIDADESAQNETLALYQAGQVMKTAVNSLDETTKVSSGADATPEGETYYNYTYTGKTGMITVKGEDNHVYYLVISSITRTGTAEVVE